MAKETGRAPTIDQRAATARRAPGTVGRDDATAATEAGLPDAPRDSSRHSEAIEILRTVIREARLDAEHAQQIFAAPYSSHDSLCAFYEKRGRWHGVGMAIEALMGDQ